MGTIQIDGSTPKLTIGNATAEDATILYDGNAKDFYISLDDSADKLVIGEGSTVGTNSILTITDDTVTLGDGAAVDTKIVFDGNAQDFYIALDDSADALLIGLGSTVGTTPAIAIDENLKVNIPVTTASTSASTGSLTTGGGAGIGADLYVGDDAYLITDSAVLGFGADKDTLLTHTDGTGLTLNSTNKLCFNDASQFVQGISATVLGLGATDEIDLTATAIDINGTCDISGTFSLGGTNMTATAAELNLLDGGTSVGSSITLADADGFVVNDGGTMKTIPASDISTYAGGGKVLQIQSAKIASATSVTSTTATATNLTDAITPSASDSKILVIVDCIIGMSEGSGTGNVGQVQLFRDIGGAGFSNIYRAQDNASISISGLDAGTNVSSANQVSMVFLDSPSTTSACTYTQYLKLNVASASGDSINSGPSSLDSTMTLIEIGA